MEQRWASTPEPCPNYRSVSKMNIVWLLDSSLTESVSSRPIEDLVPLRLLPVTVKASPQWLSLKAGLLYPSILLTSNHLPCWVTQPPWGLELAPGLCLVPRNLACLLCSDLFALGWRLASVQSSPASQPPHHIVWPQPWCPPDHSLTLASLVFSEALVTTVAWAGLGIPCPRMFLARWEHLRTGLCRWANSPGHGVILLSGPQGLLLSRPRLSQVFRSPFNNC